MTQLSLLDVGVRPMLHSQRVAYARMPRLWRPVHRWLWAHRDAIPDRVWRAYRSVWPR